MVHFAIFDSAALDIRERQGEVHASTTPHPVEHSILPDPSLPCPAPHFQWPSTLLWFTSTTPYMRPRSAPSGARSQDAHTGSILRTHFGLALFHQMHCLARIRRAMSLRQSSEHVHHCFNYLRQAILCEANPTIEPVIPILGRRSVNAEIPRTCRDWTQVYELAERSYNETIGGLERRAEGETRVPVFV